MDSMKKRTPDYTDIAYREAVSRLRYLLAESYSPHATPTKIPHVHMTKADDSGDETDASVVMSERSRQVSYRMPYYGSKRALYTDSLPKLSHTGSTLNVPGAADAPESGVRMEGQHPPPELMAFIERQEEYIEQLEKESQYCREELSSLLGKVKDVISENEGLHEKEKSGLLKSVFDCFDSEEDDQDMEQEKTDKRKSQPSKKKRLEGPSIVFESRISELEAQLTQTKIDLRKAQEEAEMYKKKLADQPHSTDMSAGLPHSESSYRQQIEILQREKEELTDNLSKLSSAVNQIREKESDSSHKVKRSLDLVDQAQFEKAQAELEVRRLKDELDRQHDKLRDLLQEQGRRVQEERAQAERRYAQQVEQLSADLTAQWDAASKLQLELEKQRRTESDLRREMQQKNVTIEELKKELQTKIAGLQSEATQSAAERGSLEQELAASRLAAERAERELRQESSRLQAEVTALRQRLDRADSDLLHSRRENLRLSEQVGALERELNLAKMMRESTDKGPSDSGPSVSSPSKQSREKELTSMILDMESKHVHTVAELESMIQSQNQLVEKLKDECHSLTQKLEDSSARHKEEMAGLQSNIDYLNNKLEVSFEAPEWRDNTYVEGREPGSEHGFEAQYESQPQFEPQPEYEPQSEFQSQPGYEPQSEFQSQPEYEPQSEFQAQDYEPQSQFQSEPRYNPQPEFQSQPEYEPQSEFQSQDYESQSQIQSEPRYDPQPEFQSQQEFTSQPDYETQPEFQSQASYEPQPNFQSEREYESQPGYDQQSSNKSQPDYGPQTGFRPQSRMESQPSSGDLRLQSGTEPHPGFRRQPSGEFQQSFRPQPTNEPHSGFRRQPSNESQPGIRPQPTNEPHPGFRHQPSNESQPAIRPQPNVESHPGIRPQPSVESHPGSGPQPGFRPLPGVESHPGPGPKPSFESQPRQDPGTPFAGPPPPQSSEA